MAVANGNLFLAGQDAGLFAYALPTAPLNETVYLPLILNNVNSRPTPQPLGKHTPKVHPASLLSTTIAQGNTVTANGSTILMSMVVVGLVLFMWLFASKTRLRLTQF